MIIEVGTAYERPDHVRSFFAGLRAEQGEGGERPSADGTDSSASSGETGTSERTGKTASRKPARTTEPRSK